ncbi:hypothetical protein ACSAZL_05425 [Methanosarcina sp. T3]|uniref:hypothetical protein n=1 Tax=Methanosarcina sp. T3 TaxID=3439062 RepID=UPI003F87FFA7
MVHKKGNTLLCKKRKKNTELKEFLSGNGKLIEQLAHKTPEGDFRSKNKKPGIGTKRVKISAKDM